MHSNKQKLHNSFFPPVVTGSFVLFAFIGIALAVSSFYALGAVGVSVVINLGENINGDSLISRTIEFSCSTEAPATITSCLATRDDFGCSFRLKEGESCVGKNESDAAGDPSPTSGVRTTNGTSTRRSALR